MRRVILIIFLALIISLLTAGRLHSQFSSYLYKYYNSAKEEGRAVIRMGNLVSYSNWSISGTTVSPLFGKQWFITKLAPDGTIMLFKSTGSLFDDSCFYMTKLNLPTNEHVLTGHIRDIMQVQHASFLITDSNYNFMNFLRIVNDSLGSTYRHVYPVPGPNFVNAGYIKVRIGIFTPEKIIACESNPAGTVWAYIYYINNFTDIFTERGYSITCQPIDNSYAITGVTDRNKPGFPNNTDIFVLKLNANGIPLWYKIYSFPPNFTSVANRIISLPDSSYAIAGYTTFPNAARNGDLWFLKIGLNGNIKWSRIYGKAANMEEAYSLEYNITNNTMAFGGYFSYQANDDILGGVIYNLNGGLVNLPTYRTNAAGNDRIYDMKYDLGTSTMNQLVSTGTYFNAAGGFADFSFLRTSINFQYPGCLINYQVDSMPEAPVIVDLPVCCEPVIHMPYTLEDSLLMPNQFIECLPTEMKSREINLPQFFELHQNFPNPFNARTRIRYDIPAYGKVTLKIYDILGKEIITLVSEELMPGSYFADFNAAELPSGLYYYSLQVVNYSETKKMILLK